MTDSLITSSQGPDVAQGWQPPFGLLAMVGASISLVFCYGQVLISLVMPLFGLASFDLNIHLQAVFMWLFGLVTVYGLMRDRRAHGSIVPLATGVFAVLIIAGTLYTFYDIRLLIMGYVLLVIAALLNQIAMLNSLKWQVEARASELSRLNTTLEEQVETQVSEIERLARLKRFLAPEVAKMITSEGKEGLLDSHRRYIACLFCDIRNFTPLSENLEPEEVMEVLQVYHERIGTLIADSGGTIGFRAGDGVMVFFNDPVPCDNPSLEAARLALGIRDAFADARRKWERLGKSLTIGIGIASGYATLGLVGDASRRDYTAIGNVVNLASRLCDQASGDEILMDRRAFLDIEADCATEPQRSLDLKGIGRAVETHALVALRSDASEPADSGRPS
ncbi:MAG: adenylate/guanylate cyclase domain-containing protein [Pseudomonadota bacterium]